MYKHKDVKYVVHDNYNLRLLVEMLYKNKMKTFWGTHTEHRNTVIVQAHLHNIINCYKTFKC